MFPLIRKQVWIEELLDGRYSLIIVPVKNFFGYKNVAGFEAYLKKQQFGNISFLIGVEKSVHFPNIEKFSNFVKNGLERGEFFYDLRMCDAQFEDRYDLIIED